MRQPKAALTPEQIQSINFNIAESDSDRNLSSLGVQVGQVN